MSLVADHLPQINQRGLILPKIHLEPHAALAIDNGCDSCLDDAAGAEAYGNAVANFVLTIIGLGRHAETVRKFPAVGQQTFIGFGGGDAPCELGSAEIRLRRLEDPSPRCGAPARASNVTLARCKRRCPKTTSFDNLPRVNQRRQIEADNVNL